MPQNNLTPARLRELIAAATKATLDAFPDDAQFQNLNWSSMNGRFRRKDADLIVYLANNASALADALEAKELLEWAISHGLSYWEREVGNVAVNSIESLRAAKEAADGTKRKEDQ